MKITEDIKYVGVNDHKIDLFEGQYKVPLGMAYNSYAIIDEKIAIMDTVDQNFTDEWMKNIAATLGGRKPDYLIVQHMEPDHSANIAFFLNVYKDAKVVSSSKAFTMMKNFFGTDFNDRQIVISEGSVLSLGKHELHFVAAPMVHWPEVMFTYDATDKVLFSADGFGKFGANDVVDPEGWDCEARRYYIGIVGKYGPQVQAVLKKAAGLDIRTICPLHGPVLNEDLGHYISLYNIWSSYQTETEGVLIAYTSVYGHTKDAALLLAQRLEAKGCPNVVVDDLAREDMAEAVEHAFRYGRIVFATTTYNAEIFPFMREFINHLTERNFQNKTVGFIENGSWAPQAMKVMKALLEKCKNITYTETNVKIMSAMNEKNRDEIEALASELTKDYQARQEETANKSDLNALLNIGYGLYVVTSNDGKKDNGCVVNAVTQVTNNPNTIAVTINKANYTYDVVLKTGIMNVNCLTTDASFDLIKEYGFVSGKEVDKFAGKEVVRSDNGLVFLTQYVNSFMSLKVVQTVDLGTHAMFICSVSEARVLSNKETMSYSYYLKNVKPKPETENAKGYVCKVCGFVYEGEELPEDYICPLCKHPASDFEKVK